ncbi:hypothetical protein J4414_04215 [Candidatus Woesearchaeota archaeon]|nr:hypothetical protein [Candidatus Woesearchaeota archaeon]
MAEYNGYCMKCKEKGREIKDAKVVSMGKGRKAAKGVCAKCGTGMYKILSKEEAAKAA